LLAEKNNNLSDINTNAMANPYYSAPKRIRKDNYESIYVPLPDLDINPTTKSKKINDAEKEDMDQQKFSAEMNELEYLETKDLSNSTKKILKKRRSKALHCLPVLSDAEWLTALNIEAFLRLIKLKYNNYNDLSHPNYYAIRDSLVEKYENSIFIVNTQDGEGFHWLVISNIGCKYLTWRVFDSLDLPVKKYTFLFKKILPDVDHIIVIKESVAKQKDGLNCGLYSLANALAIAKGDDPCKMEWINDNNLMRSHYRHCIEIADVSDFPHTERRALRTISYNLLLNNNLK